MLLRFLSSNAYITFLHRNASFRYIFLSGIVSRIGDFMLFVSLSTILDTRNHQDASYNGIALAFFSSAWVIPQAVFAPYSGVVADLMEKKNVMLLTDILRSILILAFFAVQDSVYASLLLVFAIESIGAFFNSCKESLIPKIVADEDLEIANVLDSFVWMTCTLFGCVLGGVVTILWGAKVCYVVDSLTYLVSAACVVMLIRSEKERESNREMLNASEVHESGMNSTSPDQRRSTEPSHQTDEQYMDSFIKKHTRESYVPISRRLWIFITFIPTKIASHCTAFVMGFTFLLTNPFLLSLSLAKASHTVVHGACDVLIIIHSHERYELLNNPAAFISIVRAVTGFSAGIAPVVLERWMPVKSSRDMLTIVCFSWIGVCASMGVACFASLFNGGVGALLFIAGVAGMAFYCGLIWPYSTILLQKYTPENYCGRVLALDMGCFSSLGVAYGSFISGVLMDIAGCSLDAICILVTIGSFFVGSCWIVHYFIYARQIDVIQPYWLFSEMRFSGLSAKQAHCLRKKQKALSTLKERGFSDSFTEGELLSPKIQMSQPLLKDELEHKNR